jgi:hypothetical protein
MIQTNRTKKENPVLHVLKSMIFMCLTTSRAVADDHSSLDIAKLSSTLFICHTGRMEGHISGSSTAGRPDRVLVALSALKLSRRNSWQQHGECSP